MTPANVHVIAVNTQVQNSQSGKCRNPQPGTIAKRIQPTANKRSVRRLVSALFLKWAQHFAKQAFMAEDITNSRRKPRERATDFMPGDPEISCQAILRFHARRSWRTSHFFDVFF